MLLQRANSAKPEKIDERTFRFVISDDSVDRYNSVIMPSGWMLDNYAKNGIVAYQHNTFSDNPDMIVGKGKAWLEGNRLMGEVQFEPAGQNPVADKLVEKLNFGSINATSVGFNPLDWSAGDKTRGEDPKVMYFRSQDLLEWSIVNIPANPNAIQNSYTDFVKMAFDEAPKTEGQIDFELEETQVEGLDEHKTRLLKLRLNTL